MAANNNTGCPSATAGGRLLVDESSPDIKNDRIRFEVKLKEGETTVVSWDKLLKDAGIPVNHHPSSPDPPLKRLHQEDESRSGCSNTIPNKMKDEQMLPGESEYF